MARMTDLFKDRQPLIAMAHLLPLPGTPLYDAAAGIEAIVDQLRVDLDILLDAGFDSVLFCNEGDRPYSFNAGYDGVAAMTRVVTELAPKDRPFGVDFLWDSLAALNVAMATGASFIRGVMVGAYESDMGLWSTDVASLLRERRRIGADDVAMFMNVTPEYVELLGTRSVTDVASSAVVVQPGRRHPHLGPSAGVPSRTSRCWRGSRWRSASACRSSRTRARRPRTWPPSSRVADGIIVGTDLKTDGYTWNEVDADRVERFMHAAGRRPAGTVRVMSLLLGIDVGTTGTKALLLDTDRGVVAEAERPNTAALRSIPAGRRRTPTEWWANVCATTRELTAGVEIAGVGVTGMVPCTIPLDEHVRPLRLVDPAERRADGADEVEELNRRARGRAASWNVPGSAITQQSTAPRFLWLAEHEPELWKRTRTVMGSYDYITMRLTGAAVRGGQLGSRDGPARLRPRGTWADDVLEACGASADLLPPIRRCNDVVGPSPSNAASPDGHPQAGYQWSPAPPTTSGRRSRPACSMTATCWSSSAAPATSCWPSTSRSSTTRLYLDFHLLPERFVLSGCMATSGSLIKWFQREIAAVLRSPQLDEEAETVRAGIGRRCLLPYFLGEKTPINDPEATGAFVGLQLTQGRGHLFRAVLEGIAYGFRHHLDVFEERGHAPRRVRVTDGGSRSRVWTQITADVLGLPLEKVTLRSGSAFAAAFAPASASARSRTGATSSGSSRSDEVVEPQPNDAYERNYERIGRVPGAQGGPAMSVLVTGAGAGIGEATARLLAERGYKVAVTDVDEAAAGRLADELGTFGVELDVTSRASITKAMDLAEDALGALDGWVSNAGVSSMISFLEMPDDEWDSAARGQRDRRLLLRPGVRQAARGRGARQVRSSTSPRWQPSRATFPTCPTTSRPSSAWSGSRRPWRSSSARMASASTASALDGWPLPCRSGSSCGRGELRGISPEQVFDGMVRATPLGRIETAEDVARAIVFLVGPDAVFVTGEALAVNGGAFMD